MLSFQATFFPHKDNVLEQSRIEKPLTRHLHLQNRLPDLSFVGMCEDIIPWPQDKLRPQAWASRLCAAHCGETDLSMALPGLVAQIRGLLGECFPNNKRSLNAVAIHFDSCSSAA